MPLLKGKNAKIVGKNIKMLKHEGRLQNQALNKSGEKKPRKMNTSEYIKRRNVALYGK